MADTFESFIDDAFFLGLLHNISDFIGLINWTSIPVLPALFSINLTNTDFDTLQKV